MKFGKMILSLALVAILATSASAVVVDSIDDAEDSGTAVAGQNFTFAFNGWTSHTAATTPVTAGDGNIHFGFTLDPNDPGYNKGNNGVGLVWQVDKADYETAIGHALAAGNVLRFSMWIADDTSDPTLNEGTWTESIKFEFNDAGGAEPQADGGTDEGGFLLGSNCDLGTGVCADAGQVNGTPGAWNLVAGDYTVSGAVAGDASIVSVEPVLFIGDFTGSEDEQGTFFVDNMLVEIFEDQAAADASPASASNPAPGGIGSVVPEPASAVLLLLGACGLGLTRKRR